MSTPHTRGPVRRWLLALATVVTAVVPAVSSAAVITLDTDPFAGSTALTTPGRQIVGGEPFTAFDPATDTIAIDLATYAVYGFGPAVSVANAEIGSVPASGANVVVLRTFDNDNNLATSFNAGTAANLIAGAVTTPGAGFFIYFNQGLDLPRLVFSTDLTDPTADLAILVRFTNMTGAAGQAALGDFTSANFQAVPEPGLALLLAIGALAFSWRLTRRFASAVG
ncbi:MAG: hypothetical protein AB7G23_12395 [Vicinamibacterales bacterium]